MTHSELKEAIRERIVNYITTKEYLELTTKEAISNLNRILCENVEMYLRYFGGDISNHLYKQLKSIYIMIIAHSSFLVREDMISDECEHAIDFIKGEVNFFDNLFVLCYLADEIYDVLPDCELNDDFMSYVTRLFQCIKDDILQD